MVFWLKLSLCVCVFLRCRDMPPKGSIAAKGNVAKNLNGLRAELKREGKLLFGRRRHGLNAEADAENERQILWAANTSMANLKAAA